MDMNDRYQVFARTPSPHPPSLNGHTPPMLRNAMDDVMSSLEDMGMSRKESKPEAAFNPWSPDAFDELRNPTQRPEPRPLTSLGLGAGGSNYSGQHEYSSQHNSPDRYGDGPPQLSNYVQRMENRLRQMQEQKSGQHQDLDDGEPPEPPPKNSPWNSGPASAMTGRRQSMKRKSAYELGRQALNRTFTTKSSATTSSSGVVSNATASSTQSSMTSQSIMSGHSASGFSATSAGSLARRAGKSGSLDKGRPMTSAGTRSQDLRPGTPLTSNSFQQGRDLRQGAQSAVGWEGPSGFGGGIAGLGGLSAPKTKKSGFFKKLIEGGKTVAASARSNIAVSQAGGMSPPKSPLKHGLTGIAGGTGFGKPGQGRDAAREMGLGGANSDWLKMRQDVNRSNTPGPTERQERADRCLMLDQPVICPVDELFETAEGDEGVDGLPVPDPFQINNPGLSLVDKAARFITSLPPMTNPASLAQGYVCRPHRSDVQRLRAIFTWVSERVVWDEEFEGEIDTRRVIQSKRGCSHEVAALVVEMCHAINLHAEVVEGYLKTPGVDLDLDALNRPNHYWNAILVDNEWRMMDCSLASPTNPHRTLYSSISASISEAFYFLTKPLEFCYTHVPLHAAQQHIVPPISPDVLLSLPCSLPPYFRQSLNLHAYDTSVIRLDALEICNIAINVPTDVELVAEVETQSYLRDPEGDLYESPDTVTKKRALAQASWYTPLDNPHILQKRYIVKALLPSDSRVGVLKVYAGKHGLMHSNKDIPHPLAMALPITHTGENSEYDFLTRHPTPHATRQYLYVIQPQCRRLVVGETFVFAVRQHASSVIATPREEQNGFDFGTSRPHSPNPQMPTRPTSAMSMTSSANGSNSGSNSSYGLPAGMTAKDKPAKLAVQSPGGRILRLNRKADGGLNISNSGGGMNGTDGEVQGSVWEMAVKVQERGMWRGLVLADRSARWCVWGEWECV